MNKFKPTLFVVFILMLFLISNHSAAATFANSSTNCASSVAVPQAECEALVDLYMSTESENWRYDTNWLTINSTVDVCDWYGVTCSGGSVTSLDLSGNLMSGTIPTSIGNLTNLEYLSFYNNILGGQIPATLGNLSTLQSLELGFNDFNGEIPTSLSNLSNLSLLGLWDNSLCLPDNPAFLAWLASLDAASANGYPLCSPPIDCTLSVDVLPAECEALVDLYISTDGANWQSSTNWMTINSTVDVCDWQGVTCSAGSVTILYLDGNFLNGTLPTSIGTLTSLQRLSLGGNRLSGQIPASLGNLSALQILELDRNQLTGEIPASLSTLTNLYFLTLWDNHLCLPNNPAFVAWLLSLDGTSANNYPTCSAYVDCTLTVDVPQAECDALVDLYNDTDGIRWDNNEMWLTINSSVDVCDWEGVFCLTSGGSVGGVDLSANELNGTIPASINDLPNLMSLNLSDNQLNGVIPSSLGNLPMLQDLRLNENQLKGAIPAQLGNLANLEYLYLDNNYLSGEIPASLGNLPLIQELNLSNNQLTGEIPLDLESLMTLTDLHLYDNQLCILNVESFILWLGTVDPISASSYPICLPYNMYLPIVLR